MVKRGSSVDLRHLLRLFELTARGREVGGGSKPWDDAWRVVAANGRNGWKADIGALQTLGAA